MKTSGAAPLAALARGRRRSWKRAARFVLVIGPPAPDAQLMARRRRRRRAARGAAARQRQGRGRASRSNCPAGRGARSMPARSNSPRNRGGAWRRLTARRSRRAASPAGRRVPHRPFRGEPRRRLLIAKGYRILARRFRTPRRDRPHRAQRSLIAFVEVKARASLDEAAYAVTPRQQQRIIDAAQAWLGASRARRIRPALRRHADCAPAPAAPPVSGASTPAPDDFPSRRTATRDRLKQ